MAFLSSFYPQPVVAGTTEGTFAEGDDARIVGAAQKSANLSDLASASSARANLDLEVGVDVAAFNDSRITGALPAATAGTGSVLASGSTNARTLSDRFADGLNILDYGADPTGTTDSWLAIQRAIYSATFSATDTSNDAATTTISDTTTFGGVTGVPKLFTRQGIRQVLIPSGFYKISRPLVVNHGAQLIGICAPDKAFIVTENKTFNAVESSVFWILREKGLTFPSQTSALLVDAYNANLIIENIQFRGVFPSFYPNVGNNVTRSGTVATATISNHGFTTGDSVYMSGATPFGYFVTTVNVVNENTFTYAVENSGATSGYIVARNVTNRNNYELSWYPYPSNNFAKVSSLTNSGSTTITINRRIVLYVGAKLKFSGGDDYYQVSEYTATSNTTTFTLFSALQRNIEADETMLLGLPAHNGILVNGGENTAITRCYCSFFNGAGMFVWLGSPSPVIENCMSTQNKIAYWMEGAYPHTLIKPSGDANDVFLRSGYLQAYSPVTVINMKHEDFGGYPSECLFDIASDESGSRTNLTVIGGTCNAGNYPNSKTGFGGVSRSMIRAYFYGTQPAFSFNGFGGNFYGNSIFALYNRRTGVLSKEYGRVAPTDGDSNMSLNDMLTQDNIGLDIWPEQNFNSRFKIFTASDSVADGGGIMADQKSIIAYECLVEREEGGTTATITATNHGLREGDYVALINYQNVSPWFSYTNDNGVTVYNQGTFKVLSRVNSNQFTIQVNNSGPTSANAHVYLLKYWVFHGIRRGAHVFQMPENTLSATDKTMFRLLSKDRTNLAGLVVPAKNEGQWWVKNQLTMGGASDSPSARILHGTGDPQAAAISAPNGSLYLRTDGDASTTLYVRAGGVWKPLSSYEA